MRFAVVGNCQTIVFAQCLALYFPGAEVVQYDVGRLDTVERAVEVADRVRGYERLFVTPQLDENLGPLRHTALVETHPGTVVVPSIGFYGFQPDCVYLTDSLGRLRSPLEVYHSALAAAAFTLGLGMERTVSLFNALVFARLGYFEDHARASGALVAHCLRFGLDISDRLPLWQRRAAFMYTINHPRSAVIADVTRLVLRGLGHDVPELADVSGILGEPLSLMPIFPVYPEIGRRLRLPGHYRFRASRPDETPVEVMDLPGFVARSFSMYRAMPERVAEAVEQSPRAKAVVGVLAELLGRR